MMFERFSDRARQAIVLARIAARLTAIERRLRQTPAAPGAG
jgi:hypothetical protein